MPADNPKPTMALAVLFDCEYEIQDLRQFQDGGHFVSGLKDENGFRRPWDGDDVHILTLKFKGEQVLRMMADSFAAVSRLMTDEIQQTLFGLWTAQHVQGSTYDSFVRQRDRLADLDAFVQDQYAPEIKRGQHGNFSDLVAVAMYYMGKEREMNPHPIKAKRKAAK